MHWPKIILVTGTSDNKDKMKAFQELSLYLDGKPPLSSHGFQSYLSIHLFKNENKEKHGISLRDII